MIDHYVDYLNPDSDQLLISYIADHSNVDDFNVYHMYSHFLFKRGKAPKIKNLVGTAKFTGKLQY